MGYGRSRGLRTTTTTSIFKSSLDNVKHKVSHGSTRFFPPPLHPGPPPPRAPLSCSWYVDADCLWQQWVEEANERCPNVPIILVGLKKDLREDPLAIEEMRKKSLHFTSTKDGNDAAHEIGARKYLECSSLTGEGVDDVFEAATRAALLTFEKGERGGCCVIL